MKSILLVFVGGGIGSALRFGVDQIARTLLPGILPWGTLLVNVLGGFAIGVLWGMWTGRGAIPDQPALFLMTGILGGFTTFSAFSLDAVLLWQKETAGLAILYVLVSVAASLGMVLVGMAVPRLLS